MTYNPDGIVLGRIPEPPIRRRPVANQSVEHVVANSEEMGYGDQGR